LGLSNYRRRIEVIGLFEEPANVVGFFVIDAIVMERYLVPHHSELPSRVAVVLAFYSEGSPLGANLDDDFRSSHRITSV
jgi:hypothetical protein